MPTVACPTRQTLKALIDGTVGADEERALAAHLGECAMCRTLLASVAAGDRPAESWTDALRQPPTPLGPAMHEMLDSLGASRAASLRPETPFGDRGTKQGSRSGEVPAASASALRRPAVDKSLPFLDPPDGSDCIGLLGRYRVLELLGRGGMGVVFLARDPVLDRLVAIKAVSPQLCGSPAAQQRLFREARAAAAINHANVVTIYSAEEASGLLLLVMEYIDGVSLQQHIESQGPLSLADIVRIGAEVASGLAAAHACGVVHRDIKPANILLARPAGQAKITDFGVARATDDAALTRSGVVLGTPAFMAPEQARGDEMDSRADLFSLGSVLYAMSRAAAPYSGSTMAVIRAVAEGPPAALQASDPSLPQWLVNVVSKLHAYHPADRFQSAAEVADVLRRRLPQATDIRLAPFATPPALAPFNAPAAPTPPQPASRDLAAPPRTMPLPPPPPRPRRDKRLWAMSFLGALCLILLAAIVGLVRNRHMPDVPATAGGTPPSRPSAAPVPPAAKAAPQPFVLVRAEGASRHAYAGLEAAVRDARSGDVIEIRGNEPCRLAPINLRDKSLTFRAAADSRPLLRVPSADEASDVPAVQSDAPLVLEGLDIESLPAKGKHVPPSIVSVRRGPLLLVNCRMIHAGTGPAVRVDDLANCEVRNCLLHSSSCGAIDCFSRRKLHVIAVNNIFSGSAAIVVHQPGPDAAEATLTLRRNTMIVGEFLRLHMDVGTTPEAKGGTWRSVVHVDGHRNVFDSNAAMLTFQSDWTTPKEIDRVKLYTQVETDDGANPMLKKIVDSQTRAIVGGLRKLVTLNSQQDLYCGTGAMLGLASSQKPAVIAGVAVPAAIADWNQFWAISPPGLVRLAEGSLNAAALRARASANPRSLQAADFGRRFNGPVRPGEGNVEGASTTVVGPGAPLEAWKNTIDYRTWSQAHR